MVAVDANLFPKIILRESANDGSDFSNPAADYRVAFIGEDGQWHFRDSAGVVTSPGGNALDKLDATTDPAVTDDEGDGYSGGSIWVNTVSGDKFICLDPSTGAAVWDPFESGGAADSGYIAYITALSPRQYWPLNEAAGSTTFNDVMGGTDLSATGIVWAGMPTITGDAAGGSVYVGGNNTRYLSRSAITWGAAWSIEFWTVMAGLMVDTGPFGQWDGSGAMIFAGSTVGEIRIYSGGTNAQVDIGGTYDVAGRHHWVLTHDGTTQRLWLDGVNIVSQAVGNPTTNQGGDFEFPFNGGGPDGWHGLISDIAIWDEALDSTEVNAHYDQGNL